MPCRDLARRAAFLLPLLAAACQLPDRDSMPSYAMREQMRNVEVGQTQEEVRVLLGELPVRKPGHPDDPFPTPLRVVELRAPDGRAVRLETYVVATAPQEGCPDYRYDDRPVVFIDGRVAGMDWEFVEWGWRGWGGGLDQLRHLQDRNRCVEPQEPSARRRGTLDGSG